LKTCSPGEAAPGERTVCVYRDQMFIWLEFLALCPPPCISFPGCLFHTLYDHTESDWRLRLQQRIYRSLDPTYSTVHQLFSFFVETRRKSQQRPDTPAFILGTDTAWFSCKHHILYTGSPVNNKANRSEHVAASCEGHGLLVQEGMPSIFCKNEVHLY